MQNEEVTEVLRLILAVLQDMYRKMDRIETNTLVIPDIHSTLEDIERAIKRK